MDKIWFAEESDFTDIRGLVRLCMKPFEGLRLSGLKSPYPQFPTSFPPFPHTSPHVPLIASPVSSFRSNWIFADMAISTGKQRILRIFFVKDKKKLFLSICNTIYIQHLYLSCGIFLWFLIYFCWRQQKCSFQCWFMRNYNRGKNFWLVSSDISLYFSRSQQINVVNWWQIQLITSLLDTVTGKKLTLWYFQIYVDISKNPRSKIMWSTLSDSKNTADTYPEFQVMWPFSANLASTLHFSLILSFSRLI